MKHHGIGVGYRYPHDFEGHDVDQQYLPDELAGPPLLPAHATRATRRRSASGSPGGRASARRRGRLAGRRATPSRDRTGDGMGASGKITRAREESRRKLADTQKGDAG